MKKIVTFILTLGFILATKSITASAKVDMFQTDMIEDEAQVLSTIITDNMTEYQKMKAISQYVYDNYHEYSCIDHTSAVYELATEAGIQCWALHPFETTATNGHVCNMAILDGKYYKVDGQINQILEESDLWILTTHGNGDTGIWEYIDNFPETLTIPSKALNSKNELVDITYINKGFSFSSHIAEIPDITRQKFNLKTVKISEGITTIENGAFRNLTKLETVYIPSTVTYIDPEAFLGCSALKNVIIDPKNTVYTVANGCIIKNGNELVYKYDYNRVDTLTIPDNITTITDSFLGCRFTNICIPKSVTYINDEIGISWLSRSNSKIYGVPGSYAEEFANKYNITFIDINKGIIGTLSDSNVELAYTSYVYRGYEIKPNVTVTFNGFTLKENVDYTVSYNNNINTGTAKITVTGIGDYNGTSTKTFNISKRSLTDAAIKTTVSDSYNYNGSTTTPALESDIKITCTTWNSNSTTETIELVDNRDYIITINELKYSCILYITITGKGNYSGSLTKTLNVIYTPTVTNISTCTTTLGTTSYTYDGTAKTPTVAVKNGTTTLKNGTDYTVSYSNNINAGTSTVTITGKGNYTGTLSKTFTINKKDISTATITLSQNSYEYDGNAKKPTVTVKIGSTAIPTTGYDVSYSNNVNAGTAKVTINGKNNYAGSTSANFTITKATEPEITEPEITIPTNIADCSISLSSDNYTYTGSAIIPTVIIKNNSTMLNSNDYTVSCSNNINAGTATVAITGKNNYTGTVAKTFTINPQSISTAVVTVSTTKYTYNGSAKKPTVTVKLNGKVLDATNYNVSYTNNKNIGTAKVIITSKNNYTGSITTTFTIYPAKITNVKTSTNKTTSIKLAWTKSNVDGYIVYKYTNNKWNKIGKYTTNSATIKNLTAGTTYKFAIKGYKKVNGKEYISTSYSAIKTTTIPKTVRFKLTTTKNKVKVTWNKVKGATKYIVYYKTSKSGKWTKLKTTTNTSYTKKLTSGKTYYFTVKAVKVYNSKNYNAGITTKSVKIK